MSVGLSETDSRSIREFIDKDAQHVFPQEKIVWPPAGRTLPAFFSWPENPEDVRRAKRWNLQKYSAYTLNKKKSQPEQRHIGAASVSATRPCPKVGAALCWFDASKRTHRPLWQTRGSECSFQRTRPYRWNDFRPNLEFGTMSMHPWFLNPRIQTQLSLLRFRTAFQIPPDQCAQCHRQPVQTIPSAYSW